MQWKLRLAGCGALMVLAVVMACLAVTGIAGRREPPAPQNNLEGAAYVLRDLGGSIAVYDAASTQIPLRVTGIETAALRERDRVLLQSGITAADDEELLMLLEDLGS